MHKFGMCLQHHKTTNKQEVWKSIKKYYGGIQVNNHSSKRGPELLMALFLRKGMFPNEGCNVIARFVKSWLITSCLYCCLMQHHCKQETFTIYNCIKMERNGLKS